MREMTHDELCRLIRTMAYRAGSVSALARRQGVSISTLNNMRTGRNPWTPKVLRLLGLEHVRVAERVSVPPVRTAPARPYQPMWRLGDWPSRYHVPVD